VPAVGIVVVAALAANAARLVFAAQELWREFELARPCQLGALLDAVSHGLRALPQIRVNPLPRMADFALWARACESALWPPGTFTRAYEDNRRVAIDDAIDADPVAT
jgi:hypothetical protein